MATSPMQRSLKLLRDEGQFCWIVEYWNSFSRTKSDLWTFGDILCLKGTEIMVVQTTSYSNTSARVKKIMNNEHVAAVRKAGIFIEVHGWRKDAKGKWVCRRVDLS